jgi:hypothetical protein
MAFKIAWASCEEFQNNSPGWTRIKELKPQVFITHGDTPYTNGPGTASTTQEQAKAFYESFWDRLRPAALMALRSQGMLAFWQPDDHEWTGDNWDHTVTQANIGNASFSTQAQVNTHWKRCLDALEEVMAARWDNPAFDRAGNTQRPSNALTESQNPPTTDYPIRYFTRDFNEMGSVSASPSLARVIFLDGVSYKSPTAASDGAGKHMLGTQQEEFLGDSLSDAVAAQVPYIFISTTKKFFRSTGTDNNDTMGEYPTARNRVLSLIDATGAKPISLSGDKHVLHVMETRKASGGVADLIDVCACPIGVANNALGTAFPEEIWRSSGTGFGLVTVGERARVEIRSARRGGVMWGADFMPGSNLPVYTETIAEKIG